MLSITIDQKSAAAASAGQLELSDIFSDLKLPASNETTKCVCVGQHGYVLSRAFQPGDALITISLEPNGPLTALSIMAREEALGRTLRCTSMLITGRTRSIPPAWRAFHYKNRLAFQADRLSRHTDGGRTDAGRVVLELTHQSGPCVFAFLLDRDGSKDLGLFKPNEKLFNEAMKGVVLALEMREPEKVLDGLGNAVSLGTNSQMQRAAQYSLEDWYVARLTTDQRRFVDHPLTGSVRLVGPAGSGKTVALVVKCLRELHQATTDQGCLKRFLFLTHASSTATGIENLALSMDPTDAIELLASSRPSLIITTLYSLANAHMRYDLDELTPVSLDGHEGRAFQADVLNEVIEAYRKGDWIAYKSGCSVPFVAYMESAKDSTERRFFLWELLNEFACVLDAEGVRTGTARREQYLSEKRKAWMMVLGTREERQVALNLYDNFRAWLRSEKAIGGDQMISDFLNHLDSFRWEATREQEGFDAVFVDELHLFNRQERMIFRHLLKQPDKQPTVFMAYDAKQSPRDTFLGLPSKDSEKYDFWRDAQLGKMEKIELVDVFRYSPQIAKALTYIDQSFPGQDLDDDWPAYKGISRTSNGPVPIVCELTNTIATYTIIFRRAYELQKKLGKNRRVAVLCASNELFVRYLKFTELRSNFHAITSRDDASGIPLSARKFIFSMPEYVAGLQFDTVLLIDVNKNEVPEGPFSTAALRKFASQVYLGASRAECVLEIYASAEHGGIAPLVSPAVLIGAIDKVAADALD
jgi:hypothetical protein